MKLSRYGLPNTRDSMRFTFIQFLLAGCAFALSSCASLHHVEIGEIDNSRGQTVPVGVKGSELGVNVEEASQVANVLIQNKSFQRTSDTVSDVWKMITMGPKTGNLVFSDQYPDELPSKLLNSCPSRQLTGLNVIRESNRYPVLSGEIVQIRAQCIQTN